VGSTRAGPHDEAPPAGHAEAHDEEESEHVEDKLVEKVEGALEQLDVEEGQGDVVVDGGEHGADEESEKAPEDDGVHDAGISLGEDTRLPQGLPQHEGDPLGNTIPCAAPACP
jgi:hypothetical protein